MQAAGAAPQSVASVVEDLNDYYERGAFPPPTALGSAKIGSTARHPLCHLSTHGRRHRPRDGPDCSPTGMQLRSMRIVTLEEEKKELQRSTQEQSRRLWRFVLGVFAALCVLMCVLAEMARPGLVEDLAVAYWSQVATALAATAIARRASRPVPAIAP